MQETIVVEDSVQGKFGPQLKVNGEYYNFGKFYKGQTNFGKGSRVYIDVFVSETGRKYINKVLSSIVEPTSKEVEEIVTPVVENKKRKYTKRSETLQTPKQSESKKEVDWDKIAVGKTRCLAMTQLLSSILPMVVTNPQNLEEVKEKAKELADFAVEYSFNDEE